MDVSTLAKRYAIDGPAQTALVGPGPVHVAGTGAQARFVAGGSEQAPPHGVGALLRYAD